MSDIPDTTQTSQSNSLQPDPDIPVPPPPPTEPPPYPIPEPPPSADEIPVPPPPPDTEIVIPPGSEYGATPATGGKPKKKKIKPVILISGILLLVITLPMVVIYSTNPKSIADIRSLAYRPGKNKDTGDYSCPGCKGGDIRNQDAKEKEGGGKLTLAPTLTPTPTPRPTNTPTPTPAPTATPTPAATPTPTPVPPAACNNACSADTDCAGSLICVSGSCRNGSCQLENNCTCPAPTTASTNAPAQQTDQLYAQDIPVTGGPTVLGASVIGIGVLILILGLAL